MVGQRGLVRQLFQTDRALCVGIIAVCQHMFLQHRFVIKNLVTNWTLNRRLLHVHQDMAVERTLLGERLVTNVTFIRPIACVHKHVFLIN